MSIYDKASLVLIPSGTKTSKVFSQKPVSGDGDFTFSRSTAATRVNADGNIEKETQNLLLQSNSFDNATWEKYRLNLTSGQSGYDGTNNAWLLTSTDTFSARVQQTESLTGVQVLSVYAKAGTANFIVSEKAGTNGFYVWFDLSNGTTGNKVGDIDTNIESVGNGWYRCTISGNPSSGSKSQFYIAETNGSTTISVGASIYIQDAQLEQGLVARDYIETTTAAVEGGITDNVPRLDYTDSSCPALLLEPQRTNDVAYSEYFNAWALYGGTLTANATTSPEGVQNASLYTEDTSTNYHRFNIGAGSGSSKVFSVYAKLADGAVNKWLTIDNGPTAWFDLENGVVGAAAGSVVLSIEDAGSGWYRCIYYNPTSYSSAFYLGIAASNGGAGNHTGSGLPAFYAYGAQGESNVSYATSYIPTYGTSVTRVVDGCYKTGISSLLNNSSGSLFLEIERQGPSGSGFENLIFIGDTTLNNFVNIIFEVSLNRYKAQVRTNGTSTGVATASAEYNGTIKIAAAWAENDLVLYINGVLQSMDTSVIPSSTTYSVLGLGSYYDTSYGVDTFRGSFYQSLLFQTRLSNEELAALTTI